MNTSAQWFVEVAEILKPVSHEPAYHWVKGQNIRKNKYTAMFNFSLLL